MSQQSASSTNIVLPVLPLRDLVVYPHVVVPLYVGREFSLAAIEKASEQGGEILLVAQRKPDVDLPASEDLYQTGCLAKILQSVVLADGSVKVLVEGIKRVRLENIKSEGPKKLLVGNYVQVADEDIPSNAAAGVLTEQITKNFSELGEYTRADIPANAVAEAKKFDDLSRLVDFVAYSIHVDITVRQELLEKLSVAKRAEKVNELLCTELEVCKIERNLRGRVKKQIEKNHREYYLNEKAKAIQSELGDDGSNDSQDLEKQVEEAGMPEAVLKKCKNELRKLSITSAMSPEAAVLRSYIETLVKLPWSKRSKINSNLADARRILDEDHYGLEKVKERIIEHLAVQQRVKRPQGSILCIVGAPGVGKTSLGKSIARATGREFVRMALGGLRDEAEIRGHRRTYVASMPGRILQCMTRAGVRNPVFMLDEVDKMGVDFRGDPASALLEVLDPEQNRAFMDHYAEIDYDLSEVFFIATSNSYRIPPALLDRMEIIPIAGYIEQEKIMIAKRHLVPKALTGAGIPAGALKIGDKSLQEIVRYYTREAGVRELEREIQKVCRKTVTAQALLSDKKKSKASKAKASAKPKKAKPAADFAEQTLTVKKVNNLLGVKRYTFGRVADKGKVGQVTGLAWTNTGGDLLSIEVVRMPGRGKIVRTGKLGEVMRESIEAAYSVVRSRAQMLNLPDNFYRTSDLHVHLPEGAIPKDGPSAGIGVVSAMVSALINVAARSDMALTGEITLRGEILPVGGIKEKLLAAVRGGIKHVLLPEENRKDLEEIHPDLLASMEIHFVKWIDDVLEHMLGVRAKKPVAPRRSSRRASQPTQPAATN